MDLDKKLVASMRGLALDAINKSKQGHIGMALGATNLAYNLLGKVLNFNPQDPKWINRDRFVLSAGHGSMLLYTVYHFMGLLSRDDLESHKVLYSKTPSHPEIDKLNLVDASTGPLGQGVAMAVGMALSQKYLQNTFNQKDFPLIDHHIYTLCGDGDFQEGVALEAIALAGTLKLNKLILIHDYNGVQIDSLACEVNNVNFEKYFEANNFNVIILENDDSKALLDALNKAKNSLRPTYIQVKTIIAKDTPSADQSKGHNGILNQEQTLMYKTIIGLKNQVPFVYDQDVYDYAKNLLEVKIKAYQKWQSLFAKYQTNFPEKATKLQSLINNDVEYSKLKVKFSKTNSATRDYIYEIMQELEKQTWSVIGGSADLKAACKVGFTKDLNQGGKNIKYGIREFAMSAINNGINLHSNLKTLDATFLVFSDYSKPAIRLGALMKIPAIHIFTHDSYQVGGDGPTHQPIEQLTTLRAIPNSLVIRPCDESEMLLAFKKALKTKDKQVSIIGCRQPLKSYNLTKDVNLKAYPIVAKEQFDLSILASGSEVQLAEQVSDKLLELNINAQVISIPVVQELLEDYEHIKKLKIDQKPIYALEASNDKIWYMFAKYNRFDGHFSKNFGESTDGQIVYELNGFEFKNLVAKITKFLRR